ncbi:acyltransferase family protein [Pseudomonas syringae]|uniref:acyltransferase family protein n=1 Tax=Pseudomonas syringae TaxID=317 RepID=UPI000466E405|nr:acyltransferase [Pseudomonas syringae]
MKRFLVLDSFRGLCALAVVLHHFHAVQSITELGFFRHANYLVNFFFALSGFVLYHTYADRLSSAGRLKQFVIARVCRLYPLHLATLMAALLFETLKLLAERQGIQSTAGSFTGPRAFSEILPNLLLLQSWWPGFNSMSFNFPSWSISVEFYLYLLFALMAAGMPRLPRHVFAAVAVMAFTALHFRSALFSEGALIGAGCFFSGVVTCRLYAKLGGLKLHSGWASLLEALSLVAVYMAVTYSGPSQNLSLSLLFCWVIGLFAFEAGVISQFLKKSLFKWAGALSFSIYMTHTIVLFTVTTTLMLFEKINRQTVLVDLPGEIPGAAVRYIHTQSIWIDNLVIAGSLGMVLLLSMLTHRYIELPGIALGKAWDRKATGNSDQPTAPRGTKL